MAIIILAFIRVFALTGQEGKLFHPLAFTKTFAMAAATIIAVTLVPVLCTFLLGGKFHSEQANPVMRFLQALYRPVLSFALNHRFTPRACGHRGILGGEKTHPWATFSFLAGSITKNHSIEDRNSARLARCRTVRLACRG